MLGERRRRRVDAEERLRFERDYEAMVERDVDRCLRRWRPADVEVHVRETHHQFRRTFVRCPPWVDEHLPEWATVAIRMELAKRVPVVPFEDFCRRAR